MRRLTSRLWTDSLSCELSPDHPLFPIPFLHHITRMIVRTGFHAMHANLVEILVDSAYMLLVSADVILSLVTSSRRYIAASKIHHGLCRDPSGTMIAFGDMMRKQIVMPAHLMNDNEHMQNNSRNLFKDFSSVAQATGTYTGQVQTLSELSNAEDARSFLAGLCSRLSSCAVVLIICLLVCCSWPGRGPFRP